MLVRMLELRGISKAFGTRKVLDGFDARLEPGSVTALMGPNGSGKSTLLRILWGELPADSGALVHRGAPVDPGSAPWKAIIGAVPDDDALVDGLSVRGQFSLCGALMGLGRKEANARAEELIGFLDLEEAAALPDVSLASRGNRKRVAIALALLGRPEILLMDEPFAGLDAERAELLTGLLATLSGRGISTLFSCHDESLAARAAGGRWMLGTVAATAAARRSGDSLRWLGTR